MANLPPQPLTKSQLISAASKQPPAVKKAALALMPRSRRQVGRLIQAQRAKVRNIRSVLRASKDTAQKLELNRALGEQVKVLAGLMTSAKKKALRDKRLLPAGVERISPEAVRAKVPTVLATLQQVDRQLKEVRAVQTKGNRTVRLRRKAQLFQLVRQRVSLVKRLHLLKKSLDFEAPVRLPASQLPIQRPPLNLPPVFAVPSAGDTAVIIRVIATQLPRKPGEPDKGYKHRLRAYSGRALARFTLLKPSSETGAAIQAAVEKTLRDDSAAIEAEAAAGGFAFDPAGDAMEPVLQDAAEQIEAAAEDLQPQVPAGELTDAEIDALLDQSEQVEAEASLADPTIMDNIEEDLSQTSEEEEPFYKNPKVLMGGAALVVAWLLLGS